MNLIPMIREALGLQEKEEFNLINSNGVPFPEHFRFASYSLQIHYPQGWEEAHYMTLKALLRGDLKVAKLPFKPEEGELYYFISLNDGDAMGVFYCSGIPYHKLRVKSGNCYRTREDAEKHSDEWLSKVYGENWKELLK